MFWMIVSCSLIFYFFACFIQKVRVILVLRKKKIIKASEVLNVYKGEGKAQKKLLEITAIFGCDSHEPKLADLFGPTKAESPQNRVDLYRARRVQQLVGIKWYFIMVPCCAGCRFSSQMHLLINIISGACEYCCLAFILPVTSAIKAAVNPLIVGSIA